PPELASTARTISPPRGARRAVLHLQRYDAAVERDRLALVGRVELEGAVDPSGGDPVTGGVETEHDRGRDARPGRNQALLGRRAGAGNGARSERCSHPREPIPVAQAADLQL